MVRRWRLPAKPRFIGRLRAAVPRPSQILRTRDRNRIVDRISMDRRWEITEQLGFKPKRFPVPSGPVSSVEAAEVRPPAEPGSAPSPGDHATAAPSVIDGVAEMAPPAGQDGPASSDVHASPGDSVHEGPAAADGVAEMDLATEPGAAASPAAPAPSVSPGGTVEHGPAIDPVADMELSDPGGSAEQSPAEPKAAPADDGPKAAPAEPKAAPAEPKAAPADDGPKAAPAEPKAAPADDGPNAAPADDRPKAKAADDLIADLYIGPGELDAMDPPHQPGQMKLLPDEPIKVHAERLDRPSDGPASEEVADLDQQDDIVTPPVTKREDEDIAPPPAPEFTWDRKEEEVTATEPDFGLFDDGPG